MSLYQVRRFIKSMFIVFFRLPANCVFVFRLSFEPCSFFNSDSHHWFVFRLWFEPHFQILIWTALLVFRFWFELCVCFQIFYSKGCSFSDSDSNRLFIFQFSFEPFARFQILIWTVRSFFRFWYAATISRISFRFMKDATIRFKLYFLNLMHKKIYSSIKSSKYVNNLWGYNILLEP